MHALLAASLLLAPAQTRTELPNGAKLIVEEAVQGQARFVATLAFDTRGLETPETHGALHMLEHLLAKGDGSLDTRVEANGCWLTARTERGFQLFQIEGPVAQWRTGMEAMAEVLILDTIQESESERGILAQEFATLSDRTTALNRAWQNAFASDLSPHGTPETIANLTSQQILEAAGRMRSGPRTSIAFTGAADAAEATTQLSNVLNRLPSSPPSVESIEPNDEETRGAYNGTLAYAITCGPFDSAQTAAALTVALALDRLVSGAMAIYTPSPHEGLVLLAAPAGTDLSGIDEAAAYALGRQLAVGYIDTIRNSPRDSTAILAKMRLARPGFRIEDARTAYSRVDFGSFQRQLRRFQEAAR